MVVEYGLRYDNCMLADNIPYALETEDGTIYKISVHSNPADSPPFMRNDEIGYVMPVPAPSQGLMGLWEFEVQYQVGGFFMLIIHPFLTGRLARWTQVKKWIEHTLHTPKVLFATLDAILHHMEKCATCRILETKC